MSDPAESAARWLVSGRVQGVGFRWFVQQRAERLGLKGWVRNLPDGRVEVCAAGRPEPLATLALLLEKGPTLSSVTLVERTDATPEIEHVNSFTLR